MITFAKNTYEKTNNKKTIEHYFKNGAPRKRLTPEILVVVLFVLLNFIFKSSAMNLEKICDNPDLIKHWGYIENLPTGKQLLQNINEYFTNGKGKNKKFSIEFINDPEVDSNPTRFTANDPEDIKIIINRSQLKTDNGRDYYLELPEIRAKYNINGLNVLKIERGKTYESMILAHELIHLNHYIQADNKDKATILFDENAQAKTANKLKNKSKYPELMILRVGSNDIFSNKEERKTIFGGGINAKTDDGISELSLRLEAGLNPRYIYQISQDCFLESYDNLINSVGLNKIKIGLSDFLQKMPYSDNSDLNNIKETSDFIRYTPISILNKIYPKSESKNKQLHRLIMAQFAKDTDCNDDLNKIYTCIQQNNFLNHMKDFMKIDFNHYKQSIESIKKQHLNKIKDYVKRKYIIQNLTDEQILETEKFLLNHIISNIAELKQFEINEEKVIKNNGIKKFINYKINRKIFKEFIYS